jgi:hypothetical protein
LSQLGTVSIFIAQESPTFYLISSISPVFQVLACTAKSAIKTHGTSSIACHTAAAVEFLDNTTVDRRLLSSLPTINVRMIQIPFTIVYEIKENKTNH